jgi:membrane protein implicated in regulation of membrane protease activity
MTRLLVVVAWLYVVVLMAVAEAASPSGTLLGAFFTLLLYGVLPLAIVLYLLGAPARRARRRRAESADRTLPDPDRGRHAAGDAIAPEREEP